MIRVYSSQDVENNLDSLSQLLIATVADGASIGFLPPLRQSDAKAYWTTRQAAVADGDAILFAAEDSRVLVGCVQLALEHRANGNHRAEVQKLMVHPDFRRRGLGQQLMQALEAYARDNNRTTLVLDTRQGDSSELLYQKLGYTLAGAIPQYARSADGTLHSTVFYYKLIV